MDSNEFGACRKKFWSGDGNCSLYESPDLCKFLFAHALLDLTRFIHAIIATNIVLCNSCHLSFHRKRDHPTENKNTPMEVDQCERVRFIHEGIFKPNLFLCNCLPQCYHIVPRVSGTWPTVYSPVGEPPV
jgi:hypothetical protein